MRRKMCQKVLTNTVMCVNIRYSKMCHGNTKYKGDRTMTTTNNTVHNDSAVVREKKLAELEKLFRQLSPDGRAKLKKMMLAMPVRCK